MKGRARLHAQLPIALLLAWAACEHGSRPPVRATAAGVNATTLFVAPVSTERPDADGSAARPFAGLQQALSRAPAGALLRLEPGTYEGPFLVSRPVVLYGAGVEATRLVAAPGARVPVIASDGNALEMHDLAIEGAPQGIAVARTSLRLANVQIRGQSEAALSAVSSDVDVEGGGISAVAGGQTGKGIVLQGGTLRVAGTVLRSAGRRAIELHGARAKLVGLDAAESAVSVVQALDGSEATVEGGTFQGIGGPALYASGSRLVVHGARISRAEYGVLVYRRGHLELRDAQISDTGIAGAALVLSEGDISGTTIERGGSEGGLSVTASSGVVRLDKNRIGDPGSMGLHATEATIVAADNVFTGASLDRQGDFGDAIFALESNLTLLRNGFEGNAGSGTTLLRSQAHLVGNRFASNGRAGLVLLDRSTAKAQANEFTGNRGPGVSVAERSHAMVSRNRFADSGTAEVEAPCGGGGEIDMRRNNDFLGPAAPRGTCP
jgi:Right handed beta helix region